MRPCGLDFRPDKADLRLERDDLRPKRADFCLERNDLRPERLNLRPGSPDLRPQRLSLMPERLMVGTSRRAEGQTNKRKSPCVLQDYVPFVPFLGSGPKVPMSCRTQGGISRCLAVFPYIPPLATIKHPNQRSQA